MSEGSDVVHYQKFDAARVRGTPRTRSVAAALAASEQSGSFTLRLRPEENPAVISETSSALARKALAEKDFAALERLLHPKVAAWCASHYPYSEYGLVVVQPSSARRTADGGPDRSLAAEKKQQATPRSSFNFVPWVEESHRKIRREDSVHFKDHARSGGCALPSYQLSIWGRGRQTDDRLAGYDGQLRWSSETRPAAATVFERRVDRAVRLAK